jgi:hypothetical protein
MTCATEVTFSFTTPYWGILSISTAAGHPGEQKEYNRAYDRHHETRRVEAKTEASPRHEFHDDSPDERANDTHHDVEKTALALVATRDFAGYPTSQRAKDDPSD